MSDHGSARNTTRHHHGSSTHEQQQQQQQRSFNHLPVERDASYAAAATATEDDEALDMSISARDDNYNNNNDGMYANYFDTAVTTASTMQDVPVGSSPERPRDSHAAMSSAASYNDGDDAEVGVYELSVPVHSADAGNCLPTAEEVRGAAALPSYKQKHGQAFKKKYKSLGEEGGSSHVGAGDDVGTVGGRRRNRCGMKLGIAVLVVLGAILGVAAGASRRGSRDAAADGGRSSSHYNATVDYLVRHNISSGAALRPLTTAAAAGNETPPTPQSLAAAWIADTLNLPVPSDDAAAATKNSNGSNETAYAYVARYVMAVNYYSWRGATDDWTHPLDFLTGPDICAWRAVVASADKFLHTDQGVLCNADHDPETLNLSTCVVRGAVHEMFFFNTQRNEPLARKR